MCILLIHETDSQFVGNQTNRFDDVYEGKVFKNREDFKHHMVLYALQHKFSFRKARSSPDRMVLSFISQSCTWRVCAIQMKNVDKYEIRRVQTQHTYSIDERTCIIEKPPFKRKEIIEL